jgi:hypothetical protein
MNTVGGDRPSPRLDLTSVSGADMRGRCWEAWPGR